MFKKTEIMVIIFSNHSGLKLKINYKRKTGKSTHIWRLLNTLVNNQWVKDDIKREIKKYLETEENGNTKYQNIWDAAKAVLRSLW